MSYVADHAGALNDVRAAGRAVTFEESVLGTFDATTEQSGAPTVTAVTGYALRVKGTPKAYEALKLTQENAVTLLFVPTVYGGLPNVGATLDWMGREHTVRSVNPLAPDGTAILAYVIAGR